MVNFLLLLEKIVKYSKKQIDKGKTPQIIYELCSCIRETFCLSYSIRKDNNLYLYFKEENLLLSFIGKELRYVGPDERSQALLLLKALEKGINIIPLAEARMIKSTPGIYCIKFLEERSLYNYLNTKIDGKFYFLINNTKLIKNETELEIKGENNLYIIPTFTILPEKSEFNLGFRDIKKINFLSLSKIKSIENKILYINFRKDQQEI
ncbi:MAG: hypothetical protein ACFFBE_02170 [Promethearchaeota archaeon]